MEGGRKAAQSSTVRENVALLALRRECRRGLGKVCSLGFVSFRRCSKCQIQAQCPTRMSASPSVDEVHCLKCPKDIQFFAVVEETGRKHKSQVI